VLIKTARSRSKKRDQFVFREPNSRVQVSGFRYSAKSNHWRFIALIGGQRLQRSMVFVSSVCAREYGELWLNEITRDEPERS